MRLRGYSCMHVWPTVWILFQSFYNSYPYSYGRYISNDSKNFILFLWYFKDLCKAFDTVDHHVLRDKLEYSLLWHQGDSTLLNGFPPICLIGVNLLIPRPYTVDPDLKQILCGVPQGSVLGPLLFLIYVIDLKNCSNVHHFYLFADDTNICNKIKINIPSSWNHYKELDKVNLWLQLNRLSSNIDKTNL